MLEDDLRPYYSAIPKEALGLVLGGPVYFEQVSAGLLTFLERFFAYRHVTQRLENLPVVAVLSYGLGRRDPMGDFVGMLKRLRLNVVAAVSYESRIVPCLSCGRHTECRIGGLHYLLGEDARKLIIKPEMFSRWEDDPKTVSAVHEAGNKLKAAITER